MNADRNTAIRTGNSMRTAPFQQGAISQAFSPQSGDLFNQAGADDITVPRARDVNRADRTKRRRAKDKEKRGRYGVGLHRNLMIAIRNKYRGDPRKQVAAFLDEAVLPAANGRRREVSEKTRSDYGNILQQCITDLAERRVYLENISDFTQKQVINLVRYWGEQKHAEGTIQWRVSILRRFLAWIGKDTVVPKGKVWRQTLRQNGIEAGTVGRSHLPTLPKGWVDLGIDARKIIEEVRAQEAVAGCILDCMWAFGLRFNESVQLQPRVSDKGTYLSVYRGTKGGKLREVPFSGNAARRSWQHQVLECAKSLADRHPKGVLAIKGLSLIQMKNRLRYLLRQHGISKDELGVTPHGLRHQFGTDLFQELTGLPAPVLEKVPHEVYVEHAEKVRWALLEVSRQMGHERPSISGAYLSSVPKMDRVETARLADWLARMSTCGDAFHAAGVVEAWVVGKCAFGLPLADGGALQVAARVRTLDSATAAAFQQLATALGGTLALRVAVNPWMDAERPDEGAEILFAQAAGT
jgi:site-specific recombinase XerD